MTQQQLSTADFSYADNEIVGEAKSQLISLAGEIKRQKQAGLLAMLEMGESLAEAQKVLSHKGDGVFGKWIESECWISRQSAHNYMNAFRLFGKDSKKILQSYTVEAIYALSAPSAKPEVARKAKTLAEKGVKVTAKFVKALDKPTVSGGAKSRAKSTDFDTKKLDSQPAGKPPRNAQPTVSTQQRKECLSLHAKLCRALSKVGIYDEFIMPLSQIAERLKQI